MRRHGMVALVATLVLTGGAAHGAQAFGGPESDTLFGTNEPDHIEGKGASDRIFAKNGNDLVLGDGAGTNLAANNIDTLLPGGGADNVDEGPNTGTSRVFDDDGRASRREGGDKLKGGDGADFILSLDGEADTVRCGAGDDLAVVDPSDSARGCETKARRTGDVITAFTILAGTNENDSISAAGGVNAIFGKSGDDTLTGGTGTDWIFGGRGADIVSAGDGGDQLVDDDSFAGDDLDAGPGADEVYAADGAIDTIDCGEGADVAYVDADDVVSNCETTNPT